MSNVVKSNSRQTTDAPRRRLAVLGATGSVGVSTLDVVSRHPERFEVVALTANAQADRLLAQCRQFGPRYAVLTDTNAARALQQQLRVEGLTTQVLTGPEALVEAATLSGVDTVMAAIVGAAGLPATLAAVRSGRRVLLANKEALVMAGRLFRDALRTTTAELLPIDSEHNAVLQSLPANFEGDLGSAGVRRILLTASGGPFLRVPLESLVRVTPEQACAHPNWVMGRKISVDSATMMNKGLEVIEACFLFNARPAQIEVVIHPQSVVHSMVEYVDGSVLAQLGNPDMRTPIAHALGFPHRIESGAQRLNFLQVGTLNFEAPDLVRFPCLRLAYAALEAGESGPVILNAANEVAVDRFLGRELSFDRIPVVIEEVLTRAPVGALGDLAHVLEVDREARALARECVAAQSSGRTHQLLG